MASTAPTPAPKSAPKTPPSSMKIADPKNEEIETVPSRAINPNEVAVKLVHFSSTEMDNGAHQFFGVFTDKDQVQYEMGRNMSKVELDSTMDMIQKGREFTGIRSPRIQLSHFYDKSATKSSEVEATPKS
ncbi:MAG: hypothetical protein DRI98_11875 [Bacteroidetes bacterium]|nr:MAG: hypothetical protein DRI98_11875 [Bacteroidota bacterium]